MKNLLFFSFLLAFVFVNFYYPSEVKANPICKTWLESEGNYDPDVMAVILEIGFNYSPCGQTADEWMLYKEANDEQFQVLYSDPLLVAFLRTHWDVDNVTVHGSGFNDRIKN